MFSPGQWMILASVVSVFGLVTALAIVNLQRQTDLNNEDKAMRILMIASAEAVVLIATVYFLLRSSPPAP